MDRRNAIKNLTITTCAFITLPAWITSCGISDKQTHISSFTKKEQNTLASLADAIIPPGNSIGALAVGTDKYLQLIIDDCYEETVQKNVKEQIKHLDSFARNEYNNSFEDCTAPQRQEMLMKLSVSADQDQKDFFTLIKTETIKGFSTSQQVLENFLGYKIAPGYYHGCVPVQALPNG